MTVIQLIHINDNAVIFELLGPGWDVDAIKINTDFTNSIIEYETGYNFWGRWEQ